MSWLCIVEFTSLKTLIKCDIAETHAHYSAEPISQNLF